MLTLKQYLTGVLKVDATIHSYVADRIYAQGLDISPENMPCITYFDVSEISRTVPRTYREAILQVDIWSKKNQLEVENIYERILTLLNYSQYRSGYGSSILRWQREDSMVDLFEPDRRIWHKAIRFRYWARP